MFIDQYVSDCEGRLCFSRQQGSDFAKRIADDFNPLHDPDGKRFCIPGDLLLAALVRRYGVSQRMELVFSGMVDEGTELLLPEPAADMRLCDRAGREYLQLRRGGEVSRDEILIENLIRSYVAFSGHTFPHILQPLLASEQVMINPQRPMVMYQSMSIELDTLDTRAPVLEGGEHELAMNGRRGAVNLVFNLVDSGAVVGRGCKRMLVSGLREYDRAASVQAVEEYNARKAAYFAAAV